MPTMVKSVPGLRYVPDYVPPGEQGRLLQNIDAAPWSEALSRRTQHYGWRYDYKARRVDESMHLGPLPDWAAPLTAGFVERGFVSEAPDQLIINEYLPGQGISPHIDCLPCFGPVILSLSLDSAAVMQFSKKETAERMELFLEPGSLLVLSGEARSLWRHGIPARKADVLGGRRIERGRRVSFTFRTVLR